MAAAEPAAPWTPEARAKRAEDAEQDIRSLLEDVAKEQLDARWASDHEARLTAGLAELPGTTVTRVRCASKRCALEIAADSARSASQVMRTLQTMTEFPRGRIRRTETDGRLALRVILAREVYTVWAEPDSSPE